MGPISMGGFGSGRGFSGNAMDRERGVRKNFSYDDCAAIWIRQSQHEGRAGQGRMYFEGPVIYSYRSNWPLARIVYGKGNVAFVLVNTDTASVTTSSHLGCVRHAIRSFMGEGHSVFNLNRDAVANWRDVGDGSRENVYAFYAGQFESSMEGACKKRIRQTTRDRYLAECQNYAAEANRFAAAFGDPVQFPRNQSEALAMMLAYQPMQRAA